MRSSWDLNSESDRSQKYLRNNSLVTLGCLYIHERIVFDLQMVNSKHTDSKPSLFISTCTMHYPSVRKVISDINNKSTARVSKILSIKRITFYHEL